MKNLGGLVSIVGTITVGTLIVVACGGDDVVNQTYTPDGGTSSGGTSGATSSSGTGTSSSSGETSSSGSSGGGESAYVTAYCTYLSKCSHSAFLELFGDDAGCQTAIQGSATKYSTLGGFSITADQYSACANKLSAGSCGEMFAECQFMGTLADATPCGDSIQCKGGACVKTAFAACGKCAPLGGEGAECGSGRAECQAGLGCTPNTQKCTKPLAEGATCQLGGTACSPGLKCISKKCTKPLADGADCTGAEGSCASTSFCADDKKCTALATKPANAGDSCDDPSIGCKLSSCDAVPKPNKCVALVAEGGDCGIRQLCQYGFNCRSGKCVKDDPSTCK